MPGIIDLTPGIRSLQVHYDADVLPLASSSTGSRAPRTSCAIARQLEVPTRIVHLPLSWDDPATRLAIREVHAVGAPGRALVPEQHRVHPPHQRPRQRSRT